MPNQKNITSTGQDFLDIYDITNDIIILKNGSASVVLTVNAMNFGLLAEQEQDAVIYSYAGLLNSINYPIQILIQSQTKDASSYLSLLEKREQKTSNQIKKAWIKRYSQFVSNLIKERNVLDKKFFVIIPASALEMGLTPAQNVVSGFKEQSIEGIEKSIILEKAKNLLDPKRDHLIAQFNRIGLFARQLTTQEIIRLFYTNYNPEATEGQQITNSQSYTTALVQAQIRGDYMNNQPTPPTNQAPAADMPAPSAPATPADSAATPTQPVVPPAVETPKSPEIPPTQPVAPTQTPTTPPAAAPNPLAESPTVEITQPETKPTAEANPMGNIPSTSTMPQPTKPMAPSNPAKPSSAAVPGVITSAAAPAVETPKTENVQENINQAINQMDDKPAQ